MRLIRSLFKKKKKVEPTPIVALDETDSTNQYCLDHLAELSEGPDGPVAMAVVTAEYQTAGRGQGSNSWESEAGQNLLFSIVCHPVWLPIRAQFIISECVALAVADAVGQYVDNIKVKWPNDIYHGDRKLCGILIENRLHGGHFSDCILGVGLNVNQLSFHSDAPNPVSLRQIVGHEIDRDTLLRDIIARFDQYLQATRSANYAGISAAYMASLYRGSGFHPYRDAEGEFEGAIVEVEDDGHLVMRDRTGGIRTYAFKEVEFIIK